jgi:putative ABC transport system permease protein
MQLRLNWPSGRCLPNVTLQNCKTGIHLSVRWRWYNNRTNLILRTREFGILRAVGMAPDQMKKMVCLEGTFYGLIAAIYGSVIGTLLARVLYVLLNKSAGDTLWRIPWSGIAIATGAAVLVGLLSAVVPLRRIADMNIIDSIRTIE